MKEKFYLNREPIADIPNFKLAFPQKDRKYDLSRFLSRVMDPLTHDFFFSRTIRLALTLALSLELKEHFICQCSCNFQLYFPVNITGKYDRALHFGWTL